MRAATFILCIIGLLGISARAQTVSSQTPASGKRIVIAASTVLDGRGRVLRDTRIVIEGAKIVAIDPKAGPVDYDLRGLTVLPGWIDAHVHITWSFGPDGKNAGQGATTPHATYSAASNAWVTLMASFTTVQDVGSKATTYALLVPLGYILVVVTLRIRGKNAVFNRQTICCGIGPAWEWKIHPCTASCSVTESPDHRQGRDP